MKKHNNWLVLTRDQKRTINYGNKVIIRIKASEVEELLKEVRRSIRYWKSHNKEKSRRAPAIKDFYKHLNTNTSFLVSFK